ncbi:hypothetical protein GCM10010211_53030 [Streptomyces albospinus]|uniref:Allantoicase domain-containing protein n=1 Tax=Streptomyces albospinus TaxID=285515 RepID=A0ABQ2VCP4_9ACTN|nr:hypothetical protein GCM10010211_53030 [Streptomyces albospinus]
MRAAAGLLADAATVIDQPDTSANSVVRGRTYPENMTHDVLHRGYGITIDLSASDLGAGWAGLSGRDGESGDWVELLPRTRLQPDTVHRFMLDDAPATTHVRMDIFPDGGIARLRPHGSLTEEGARRLLARYQELGG